jgi:PST family polysaccharide transporter
VRDNKLLSIAPDFFRRKLSGRHVLQKMIGNTGWVIFDKLLRFGVGLVVGVWTARYLGPTEFGLLSYAIAFVALFSTLSNLGLQGIIVRDLVSRPDRREALLGTALLLRVVGSVVAVACADLAICLLRASDSHSRDVVFIVALSLLPQAWDVIEYDYQADINARPIVVIRSVSFLVCSVAKILLIMDDGSIIGFAWITALEFALSAGLMNWLADTHRKLPRLSHTTREELRYLLRTCWPLAVTSLSVVLYWRIDQVMLGQLAGDESAGIFSAAVRVSEVWYFIPVAILTSIAPALTGAYRRSIPEYLQKFRQSTGLLVGLAVVMAIIFSCFSTSIINLLYGPKYAGAGIILSIHAWAGIFVVLGLTGTGYLVNSGLLNYSMYQTLLGAAANIVLNMIFIPRLGGAGAAISTVASQIAAGVLLNAAFPKCQQLFWLQVTCWIPGRRPS